MNEKHYKYISLIVLLLQNVMMVLTIRYSRMNITKTTPIYLTSVIILFSEILKFLVCNLIVFFQLGFYWFYKERLLKTLISYWYI